MALIDCNAAFAPLELQKSMLEMNPHADYILWGNIGTPHAVRFLDHTTCITFRIHRDRVFRRDGDDIDSLVYLLMTLIPVVRPRNFLKETLCAQLGREFGYDRIQKALSCIKGKKYMKDGKEMTVEEIPTQEDERRGKEGGMECSQLEYV
jgi:hypothetical protein